jgi:hypothetical protein
VIAGVPVLAGIASTVIFASSTMPMLGKALRTRELGSYSLGNLTLANVGNGVHSVYVFSLAPGPLWVLHTFYLASTAFMLAWYLRFETWAGRQAPSRQPEPVRVDDDRSPAGYAELGEDRRDVVVGGLG